MFKNDVLEQSKLRFIPQPEEKLQLANEQLYREIAECKQASLVLLESEERFRVTFNQAAVGIAHMGIDGKWLLVNQKFCDIVGYTQFLAAGTNFWGYYPP